MTSLPEIPVLKKVTQSLATLDLIMEPEWEYRYFSYNSKWSDTEELASMRNGSGDEWFLLFHVDGWAGLKGFSHESPASSVEGWSETLQAAVPSEFESFSQEPAFRWDSTTFCLWSLPGDLEWTWAEGHQTEGERASTGADTILHILVAGPSGYRAFALDYFEQELEADAVRAIFEHQRLVPALVKRLNPRVMLADIMNEVLEIGYPIKSPVEEGQGMGSVLDT